MPWACSTSWPASTGRLLIHDEIATGFHRTGPLWAGDRVAIAPDILCVGKALTGGYLTLAAVLCTREVAEGVSRGEAGGLMHGPTFMGNPLACAIAWPTSTCSWRATPGRRDPDRAGAGGGLCNRAAAPTRRRGRAGARSGRRRAAAPAGRVPEVTAAAIERGVWLRPFRDLVYTMPPYVTSDADLALVTEGLVGAVAAVHG